MKRALKLVFKPKKNNVHCEFHTTTAKKQI